MQMDAAAAFAHLRIGRRPFARFLQIPLEAFISLVIRNIKVDNDMILRKLDIVEPAGVQLREFGGDTFPLFGRCFIGRGILRRAVSTLAVKYRLIGTKLNELGFLCFGLYVGETILKLFRPKPTVVVPNTSPVIKSWTLVIRPEIVLQLFLKCPFAQRIVDFRLLIVGFVHLPGGFQRYTIFLLEHRVAVHYEVVEVIGCPQHGDRNIIVIIAGVFLIDLLTVIGDGTELEVDLFHDSPVLRRRELVSRWGDVDEPSDQTRLGVRNLDGLICTDEQEALESATVGGFELFVHRHLFVGNKAVQTGVVLDSRQFSVVFDSHQRVRAKCLQGEGVAGRAEIL